ncbi:MAG: hypothetical protein AAGM22_03660 [Acidobacteriota bacterium]
MTSKRSLAVAALAGFLLLSAAAGAESPATTTLAGAFSAVAADGTEVTYTFTADGQVNWTLSDEGFTQQFPDGIDGDYKIVPKEPHWTIDISNFNHPMFQGVAFLGILEVLDKNSFRMEGAPSRSGDRLQAFSEEALVFTRSE